MKNLTTTPTLSFLMLLATACGSSAEVTNQNLSEHLPNQMVSLDTKVTGEGFSSKQGEENESEVSEASSAPSTFTLAETAERLGNLSTEVYLETQEKWIGSDIPACNFFLISAMCESGYCEHGKPFYKAADFDLYFTKHGWQQIDLPTLQQKSLDHETMDVVFQKEGVTEEEPGHVLILISYDETADRYTIAEGSLGTITNTVKSVSKNFLLNWNGGFRIFIRQPTI